MPSGLKQAAFTGGELAPALQARTDLQRYMTSVKTCRNFIVRPGGGVVNRPGTTFVNYAKFNDKASRLIRFVFNSAQSYALEFGDQYVRFHKDGGTILDANFDTGTHDGADDASTLTDTGAAWAANRLVGGTVRNTTDGSEGTITANDGTTVTAVLRGGTGNDWDIGDAYEIDAPYEVATTYLEADLPRLKVAQSNDVLTITHQDYAPRTLTRSADDSWALATIDTTRDVQPPTDLELDATHTYPTSDSTHKAKLWVWVITSVAEDNEESLVSEIHGDSPALYTDLETYKINWTAPTTGPTPVRYNIYRGRNGVFGYVGSSEETTFEDEGHTPDYADAPPVARNPFELPSTVVDAYQEASFSGATATKTPAAEAYNDQYVFWFGVTVAGGESITLAFKSRPAGGGAWTTHLTKAYTASMNGYLVATHDGLAASSEFEIEITASTGSPSVNRIKVYWYDQDPNPTTDHYPSCVSFYDQRLVFGGFKYNVQQVQGSKTGEIYNFDQSQPAKDNDALDFTLSSLELDEIRSMVPLKGLIILTAGGIWRLRGVQDGPLTPSSFDAKSNLKYGASWLDPLLVGKTVIFAPERGASVRAITTENDFGSLIPRDLTVMASHLFKGYGIEDWTYADEPFNAVWAVRDDGMLLGMTYLEEHEVWAWHRHYTGVPTAWSSEHVPTLRDLFESVCAIPEGSEHVPYFIVKRTIDGGTVRYVERLNTREVATIDDAIYVDSALTYDGLDTSGETVTIDEYDSGGWLADATVEITCSGAEFSSDDVGKRISVTLAGVEWRGHVTSYVDTTTLRATAVTDVPAAMQSVAISTWGRAVATVSGLEHLEGEEVELLVDGAVHTEETVASGAITLGVEDADFGLTIQVGIGYYSDLETLGLHIPANPTTYRDRRKTLVGVSVEVENARAFYCGQDLDHLTLWKARTVDLGYETAVSPTSDLMEFRVENTWRQSGGVSMRVQDPVPVEIISAIPRFGVGG